MNRKTLIVSLFFVIYFFVGLKSFADYGVTMDEATNRRNGYMAYSYVFEGNPNLLTARTRTYGPAFEIILYAVERLFFSSADIRTVFLARHFITFLLFFLSVIVFYKLCYFRYKNWSVALLGCLMLVLSPRIFSHSFYNSKDIAFLAVFLIGAYTFARMMTRDRLRDVLIHALITGLLIDIRIMGILLLGLTVLFYSVAMFRQFKFENLKIHVLNLFLYVVVSLFFMYLFWPTLWHDPIGEFFWAFQHLSKHPWDSHVMYMGRLTDAFKTPWHYLFVWIGLTTPVMYLILFAVGLVKVSKDSAVINLDEVNRAQIFDWFCLAWLVIPLMAVLLLKSVVYDGWRHVFFIYPALLMIALGGYHWIMQFLQSKDAPIYKITRATFLGCVAVLFISTIGAMVRLHPYQNIYFNSLAGDNLKDIGERFELDYWGLSYREGLELLLKYNNDPQIAVAAAHDQYLLNAIMLKKEQRERLFVCGSGERYLLSNYRYGDRVDDWERLLAHSKKIIFIRKDKAEILGVYRMPKLKYPPEQRKCKSIDAFLQKGFLLQL